MAQIIATSVLLLLWILAAVASIHDPKPMRRPPEWAIGALIDRSR